MPVVAEHFGIRPWEMQDLRPDELDAVVDHLNQLAEHAKKARRGAQGAR